jgi:hypothetical protein
LFSCLAVLLLLDHYSNEVATPFWSYPLIFNHGFRRLLANHMAKLLSLKFCLYRNMLYRFANWIIKTVSPHILVHVHILNVLTWG